MFIKSVWVVAVDFPIRQSPSDNRHSSSRPPANGPRSFYGQSPTAYRPPYYSCFFAVLRTTLCLISFSAALLLGQEKSITIPMQQSLAKQTDRITRAALNSNEWSYWVLHDGQSGRNPLSGKSGGLYPNRRISSIFADGLFWGGYVDDSLTTVPLRVGGSDYRTGQVPGRILPTGIAQDPDHPEVRIYRVRSDFPEATDIELLYDAAQTFDKHPAATTTDDIARLRANYRLEWDNWPGHLGAPYVDLNNNGLWDPGLDRPGLPHALQTIWFVTNDFDGNVTNDFYGSPQIGMEIQHTFWTVDIPGLKDVIYRRVRLINKSEFNVTEMYLGVWSDVDLGYFGDDLVGSDSLLALAYIYNGFDEDDVFAAANLKPAAVGHIMLQGAACGSPRTNSHL